MTLAKNERWCDEDRGWETVIAASRDGVKRALPWGVDAAIGAQSKFGWERTREKANKTKLKKTSSGGDGGAAPQRCSPGPFPDWGALQLRPPLEWRCRAPAHTWHRHRHLTCRRLHRSSRSWIRAGHAPSSSIPSLGQQCHVAWPCQRWTRRSSRWSLAASPLVSLAPTAALPLAQGARPDLAGVCFPTDVCSARSAGGVALELPPLLPPAAPIQAKGTKGWRTYQPNVLKRKRSHGFLQ